MKGKYKINTQNISITCQTNSYQPSVRKIAALLQVCFCAVGFVCLQMLQCAVAQQMFLPEADRQN